MTGRSVKEQVTEILSTRIGPLVQKIRKEKGLSVREISNISGVSLGYLYEIERGNYLPSLVHLGCICVAFGMDVTTFMSMAQNEGKQ